MSNIYLKFTIEENWHSQNFDFLDLRNSSSSKKSFLLQLKYPRPGSKSARGFSIILILKETMTC